MARILLIETNKQERELHATLLYYNGFDVEQAASAETGIAAARRRRPDLIMIDYRLHDLEGVRATKLLKQVPVTADIPVICLSESDLSSSVLRSSGADRHLRKPVSGEVLASTIRALIGAEHEETPASTSAARALIIAGKESPAAASLMAFLQKEGFKVSRAADGITGLGTIAIVEPKLLFVHLNAPVVDGWSVLKRLRQDVQRADIPVVAFSDAPSSQEEQRALEAGFASYLQNIDAKSLGAEIARHVKHGGHNAR